MVGLRTTRGHHAIRSNGMHGIRIDRQNLEDSGPPLTSLCQGVRDVTSTEEIKVDTNGAIRPNRRITS